MIQLFKNARLAAGVLSQHFIDDPFLLYLQAARRLPSVMRPLGNLASAVFPRDSVATPVVLAALSNGNDDDVKRRLELAVRGCAKGERDRRLAEIALSAGLTEISDALLARASGAPGFKSARARRLWHDGNLSEAVRALDGSGAAGRRQQARLAGEQAVFAGAAPSLQRQDFTPVPRRVLHLLTNSLPHTASGYAQRSHSIMVAQQEAGWDVLAVTRLGYPVQVGKFLARASDVVDGVRYRRLLPSRLAPTMDARLQQQAEELLRVALQFRPSVLHTTTHFVNGMVVRAVAEALDIPWVYEVRGQLADTWAATRAPEARDSEKYRLFQDRETDLMGDADLVVTLGDAMKANILAAGIPGEKIIIAPNAVGGAFLQQPAGAADARRELGLEEDGYYIGTVSSLVAYEGINDLIEAYTLIARKRPDVRLLIVGDGVSKPLLQAQARQSGFSDRIIFTGRVPQERAVGYHRALDVFVVPRRDLEVTRSVTPLKPVEALACARPVVASRLPALMEIVTDGVNGLLANAEDSHDIALKLESLINSEELRTRLGRAGRQDVLDKRTWRANALSLTTAYERLLVARP
jgi:glycosyltransferase involved in cell wall biosynthesis